MVESIRDLETRPPPLPEPRMWDVIYNIALGVGSLGILFKTWNPGATLIVYSLGQLPYVKSPLRGFATQFTVPIYDRFKRSARRPVPARELDFLSPIHLRPGDQTTEAMKAKMFLKDKNHPRRDILVWRTEDSFTTLLLGEGEETAGELAPGAGGALHAARVISLPYSLPPSFAFFMCPAPGGVLFRTRLLDKGTAARKLKIALASTRSKYNAAARSGKPETETLAVRLETLEKKLRELERGHIHLLETGIYLLSPSRGALSEAVRILRGHGFGVVRVPGKAHLGTILDLGHRGTVLDTQVLSSSGIGRGLPHGRLSPEEMAEKGILYLGVSTFTNEPIGINVSRLPAWNTVILGKTGAGKSFLSKLVALRATEAGVVDGFFIIDPLGDFRRFAEGMTKAGYPTEFVEVPPGAVPDFINPIRGLDLDDMKTVATTMVTLLADAKPEEKASFESSYMGTIGRGKGPRELIRSLKRKKYGARIAAILESYLSGTPFSLPDAPRVVVSLRKIMKQDLRVYMPLMTVGILRQLQKSGRRLIIVDEAWYFLESQESVSYFQGLVRHVRHYRSSLFLITQDYGDLTKKFGPVADTFLRNSYIQVLMRHDVTEDLVKAFELDDSSVTHLREATGGLEGVPSQGLVIYDRFQIPAEFPASDEEIKVVEGI